MNIDQGYSSVYVNWTKQVCLQTRLKWWEWWGTPDIIWNRVPDRRRSKRKWTITKCCLTVCRSIEKRHGVWAGASVAGVQWLFVQHVSDIWWCSTAYLLLCCDFWFLLSTPLNCRHYWTFGLSARIQGNIIISLCLSESTGPMRSIALHKR